MGTQKRLRLMGYRSFQPRPSSFRARERLTTWSVGRGGTEATTAYLDKDDSSNGFQDQHDCHGEGVDAGIVLHERIVLHAVAHRGLVPLHHCGVLFGGKAL